MILSLFNLAFFLSMLIYKWKRKRRIDIGVYIMIVYLISALFSVVIMANPRYYGFSPDDVDIFASITYWILISVGLYPFIVFDSGNIKNVVLGEERVQAYKLISWILIILVAVSVVTSFETIRDSVVDNDFSNLYLMAGRARRTITYTRFSGNFWDIIVTIAPSFAPVLLLFFFYNMSYLTNEILLNTCLLLASLAKTMISVTTGSRTQLIYWFLSFGALWLLFRNCLPKRSKRIITILTIGVGTIGFTYFMIVTIGRFSTIDSNAVSSLVSYIGQVYIQFCRVFDKYVYSGVTWDRTFPIITKYVFGHDFNLFEFRIDMSNRLGIPVGVFFTYLGDAMLDFGRMGMFIYQIILFLIEMKLFRLFKKEQVFLFDLIIILMLIRIPLLGIFAYVYKSVADSVIILSCLLMRLLLKNSRIRIVLGRN